MSEDIIIKMKKNKSNNYNSFYDKFNATEKYMPKKTLNELFQEQVKLNPQNVAVSFNNQRVTYEELDRESDLMACYLVKSGIKEGELVAVNTKRCIETIINILGILKSGAGYVPIDPDYPKERIDYILRKSNTGHYIKYDDYIMCKKNEELYKDELNIEYDSSRTAYVIYTSGSTGEPKGVSIAHESAVNTILDINERFSQGSNQKIIGISSMCFDLSIYDIFGALLSGSELVMIRDQRDLKNVSQVLEEREITVWNSVPAVIELLLNEVGEGYINEKISCILLSGDWIPVYLPNKLKSAFPNAKVISLGGATEASIWSIYYEINEVNEEWKSIPYGAPLANQKFYILNYKKEVCPIGVKGEIYIGGCGLAQGYYNDEEKTKESFIIHSTLGRIYKTGDYGIMHKEGYIEFCGRVDNQAKINGYRIELGEIEACLADDISVSKAIALDAKDGKINVYIKSNGEMKSSEYYREVLLRKLPSYMIPSKFIEIESIPLTLNGKIDRQALAELKFNNKLKSEYEAPSTETEKSLAEIIEEAMNDDKKLSRKDSFYEIGINSVMMVQIINKIQDKFNIKVNFRDFIKVNNLIDLAEYVDKEHENNSLEETAATDLESDNKSKTKDNILTLFIDKVKIYPDNYAIKYNEDLISYKFLDESINQVSNYLISMGINKEDKILIKISSGINMIISMLGAMKIGAVPLMITTKEMDMNPIIKDLQCRTTLDYEGDYFYISRQSKEYECNFNIEDNEIAYIVYSYNNEKDEESNELVFNTFTYMDVINKSKEIKEDYEIAPKDTVVIMTENKLKYINDILLSLILGTMAVIVDLNHSIKAENIIETINKSKAKVLNVDYKYIDEIMSISEEKNVYPIKNQISVKEEKYYWSPVVQWNINLNNLYINSKKYGSKYNKLFPSFYFKLQSGLSLKQIEEMYADYNLSEIEYKQFVYRLIEERVIVNSLLTPEEIFSTQNVLYNSEFGDELIYNADSYYKFKHKQLEREKYNSNNNSIKLESIEYPSNIENRRSCRKFKSDVKVNFSVISQLISTLKQYKDDKRIHYNYSSAGGFYPVDTYVYVKEDRIEDLKQGIYYYNPIKNCLNRINSNIIDSDSYYYTNKDIFKSSALTFYFVYNAEVSMPRYKGMGYYYACLDTGIMVSTLTQIAELLNLGVCSIGDFNYKMLSDALGLSENEILMHAVEVGLKESEEMSEFLKKVYSDLKLVNEENMNISKKYKNLISGIKVINLYDENSSEEFRMRIEKIFDESKVIFKK